MNNNNVWAKKPEDCDSTTMKINTPKSRLDLRIKKGDKVLEIGPGSNPTYRANVVVDKFQKDNTHRSGNDIRIFPHQTFVNAAAEALPFADKEFDYVICHHVLEHSNDPAQFLREITRVGKAGYIETPSLLGEWIFPTSTHRYVVLSIDDKLVLYNKNLVGNNFDEELLKHLPEEYRGHKIEQFSNSELIHIRYEWKDDIDFIVNPTEEHYSRFFLNKWDLEMLDTIYPKRNCFKELFRSGRSFLYCMRSKFRRRKARRPIPLKEQLTRQNNRKQG